LDGRDAFSQYQSFLRRYGFPELPTIEGTPEVIRTVRRDIDDLGRLGLVTIPDIGQRVTVTFDDCAVCMECVNVCPERALTVLDDAKGPAVVLDQSLCNGVACRRCERACPEKSFKLECFFTTQHE
jgi:methylamine methyltransferase corrinoid activation protein